MAYLTVAQYKAAIDIAGTSTTDDDDVIQRALDAATAALDAAYGRSFAKTTATKEFIARAGNYLDVRDLISVSSLKIDTRSDRSYATTLAVGSYRLEPLNEARYQRIAIMPLATQGFWPGYMVQVTGDWGYVEAGDTPPPAVVMACQILAHRLVRRKDAPFGILAAPEMGDPMRLAKSDPDVYMLMEPFSRVASVLIA